MTEKRVIDWVSIEREYRAGQISVGEIERRYHVSDTAILKRAKKHGWKRDLAAQVRAKTTEQLVVADAVGAANVQEVVEMAAERATAVVHTHRADINKGRDIIRTLFDELEHTNQPEVLDQIQDDIAEATDGGGAANAKRRAQMLRAVSLPSRAGTIKALASALRDLIPLERQAFNLDPKNGEKTDAPADHVPVEERVKRYAQGGNVVAIRKTG